MKKLKRLTESEMKNVYGGRLIVKYDLDGDGKWEIKIITRRDGTTKTITR